MKSALAEMIIQKIGTSTSGNYGHAGRPGQVGGSTDTGGLSESMRKSHEKGMFSDETSPYGAWGVSMMESSNGLVIGFRGVSPVEGGTFGNTEGDGRYIAQSPETAAFFGEPKETKFVPPSKPFMIENEELYILQESDKLEEAKSKNDTPWLAVCKEAFKASSKKLKGEYDSEDIGRQLTKILKKKGHDGVRVRSGGEEWVVIFDNAPTDRMQSITYEGKKSLLDILTKGGSGSGNYGHAGRIGQVGGSTSFGVGIYDKDDRDIDDIEVKQQALFDDIYCRELDANDFISGGKYHDIMEEYIRKGEYTLYFDASMYLIDNPKINRDEMIREEIKRINEDSMDAIASDLTARVNKRDVVNNIYEKIKDNKDFTEYIISPFKTEGVDSKLSEKDIEEFKKDYIKESIRLWAKTSADHAAPSIATQLVAKELFKVTDSHIDHFLPEDDSSLAGLLKSEEKQKKIRSLILQTQYDLTQEYLKKSNVSELILYRGVQDIDLKQGKSKKVNMQPLSSFSVNGAIAFGFASGAKPSLIISVVPASKIFALPNTGIGCTNEFETVVLGGEIKSTVLNKKMLIRLQSMKADDGVIEIRERIKNFWDKKSIKKDIVINLDEELINADWTKQTWDVDIPKYGSKEFEKFLKEANMTLEDFQHLPLYYLNYSDEKKGTKLFDIVYKGGSGSGNYDGPGRPRYNKRGLEVIDEKYLRKNPEEVKKIKKEISSWEGNRKSLALFALDDMATDETGSAKGMIIKDKKETVGIIVYENSSKGNYIHLAMVATKRKGYGKDLVKDIVEKAVKREMGVKLFSDIDAIDFYDAIGVKPKGKLIKGSGRNYGFTYNEAKKWLALQKKMYEEVEPESGIFVNNRGLKKKEVNLFDIVYKHLPGQHDQSTHGRSSSGTGGDGSNILSEVDRIISDYLPRFSWDTVRPESPPLKGVVFRVMKDNEFENIKKGETSGSFWSSDPTEYGRGAFGESGKESDDVLVVANHKKEWGQIYRGLVLTREQAEVAHFHSTHSRKMEDIIAVYKWDKKTKLERIYPEMKKKSVSLFDIVYKHLPGQHDQSTHGRSGSNISERRRSGEQLLLPGHKKPRKEKISSALKERLNGLTETEFAKQVSRGNENQLHMQAVDHKLPQELYVKEVEKKLQENLKDVKVCIRISEDNLEKVLLDKQFKSQFESLHSAGYYGHEMRGKIEKEVMNNKDFDRDTNKKEATIYGYLAQPDDIYNKGNLDHYGEVIVELKKDVRARTSFTDGDSLDENMRVPSVVPSLVDNPSIHSLRAVKRREDALTYVDDKEFGIGGQKANYWEAQIHGGVKTSDIKKVLFWNEPPSKELQGLLKKNKISWSHAEDRIEDELYTIDVPTFGKPRATTVGRI